jgi:hypothetical protein
MKGEVHPKLGTRDDAGNFRLRRADKAEIAAARKEAARARRSTGQRFSELSEAERTAQSAAHFEGHFLARWLRAVVEYGPSHETTVQYRRDYAVNLRDQGRYAEAAQYADDPKFIRGLEAVDRDDDAFCDCQPDTFKRDGVMLQVPLYSFRDVLGLPRHGGRARVWRCKKCGLVNVSHKTPPQMRRILQLRKRGVPDTVILRV